MTPTRLALLSPAAGSRQCRASTDLGRGPHVSSSLQMHLPISPLPSSFLSLSLPSFFHLSLSFFLDYSFASSFSSLPLFLKICSFHIPSTNPPWRRQTKSSQPQEAAQPLAKLDAINTGVAEELHASLQPPLPHLLASLALCGQHTPQAHKGNAGQSPSVLVMTLILDIGRWEPWGSSVQGKHSIAHELIFIKANCIFLKQTF